MTIMKGSLRFFASSLLATATLLLALPGQNLLAQPFGGGAGTDVEPYQISTIEHLHAIRGEYLDDHFLLTTDLDFSGHTYADPLKGWLPIGHDTDAESYEHQGTPFTGSFDGAGHVIRDLHIYRRGEDFVGLFGLLWGGSIVSLGLEDLEVKGGEYVGGLVGWVGDEGTVTGSYATGSVTGNGRVGGLVGDASSGTVMGSYATGSVTGSWAVGGLVGDASIGRVTGSYATGSVTGNGASVGGLVGHKQGGTVTGSYATGSVTGNSRVGGLVGSNQGGRVTGSYATGSVTAGSFVGGLVGHNLVGRVTGSYATGSVTGDWAVGGLVGYNQDGTVTQSYWNTELSGNADSDGGVGLTTDEMYVQGSFSGFDFDGTTDSAGKTVASVWLPPVSGQRFPHLRGVSKNGQVLSIPRVEVIPGSAPFLLEHTFLPPTISGQAPVFSGDDDAVATIDASTGRITLAMGVTGGEAVTITVRRGGDSTYSSVTMAQTIAISKGSTNLLAQPFGGGAGTDVEPYEISTIEHLNAIRGEYLDDHFLLTTDLDFSGYTYDDPAKGWLPVGHDTDSGSGFYEGTPFAGSFDGAGHVIRDLHIYRRGEDFVGLFGLLWGGSIVSLGLEDLEVTGDEYVGGLVGDIDKDGRVTGSYATGSVTGNSRVGGLVGDTSSGTVTGSYATGSVTGDWAVGGLVGDASSGTVTGSYATGSVTGSGSSVGGLVGENGIDGMVTGSYATGSVMGSGSSVGGLVGSNQGGTVTGSYATGSVTAGSFVGGLVGDIDKDGTVTGSYATGSVTGDWAVGGLVGYNQDGTVTQSYWNTELSGNADSDGGVGLTTAEMYVQGSFAGFDFDAATDSAGKTVASVWLPSVSGQRFPHLRGVSKNGQVLSIPRVEVIPGSAPFLLEHTFLPPTISGQAPVFSGDDDAVATIDASTGRITLAVGVTGGEAVTITVRRVGDSTYSSVTMVQTIVISEGSTNLLAQPFGGEAGTDVEPYEISTIEHLNAIRGEYLDDHFLLTTDLDFSGYTYADPAKGWLPIGHDTDAGRSDHQGTPFTGSFDGAGHVIRDLHIYRRREDFVGLFGLLWGGSIVSLGLEDLEVTGDESVGGLVGDIDNDGRVTGSYATGSVTGKSRVGGLVGDASSGTVMGSYATGSVTGFLNVGGLVGDASSGTVTASYATGSVTAGSFVGGLVGYIQSGTVTGSYATGSVTGSGSSVGGLVGSNQGSTVTGSYATGSVTGNSRVGGLVGHNLVGTVTASYATGSVTGDWAAGGLVGYNQGGTVTQSYWNTELSGNTDSDGGVGLTTAEMYVQGTFAGFDFDGRTDSSGKAVASVWLSPVSGQHFPHLRGVSKNGQVLSIPVLR